MFLFLFSRSIFLSCPEHTKNLFPPLFFLSSLPRFYLNIVFYCRTYPKSSFQRKKIFFGTKKKGGFLLGWKENFFFGDSWFCLSRNKRGNFEKKKKKNVEPKRKTENGKKSKTKKFQNCSLVSNPSETQYFFFFCVFFFQSVSFGSLIPCNLQHTFFFFSFPFLFFL